MIQPVNIFNLALTLTLYIVLLGLATTLHAAPPTRIDIFLTKNIIISDHVRYQSSIKRGAIRIHYLDGLDAVENVFNKQLSADPEIAKKQFFDILNQNKTRVHQLLGSAKYAMEIAVNYKIKYYPAIVFNQGQSVVYGVSSIDTAMKYYNAHQAKFQTKP